MPFRDGSGAGSDSRGRRILKGLGGVSETRVRFAPSPTGYLHVGGARTALFNWLFARHAKGSFIIRIEDTDSERSTGEFETMLLEDLRWLGLTWDEGPGAGGDYGPYRQTERTGTYREFATRLVSEGKAFPCFCTDEALEAKREEMMKAGKPPQYDGACRNLGGAEREAMRAKGFPESVRFLVGGDPVRKIDDIARGEVSFPTEMVGDFVILRSNGLPTYNFAAAVDDAMMKITHVIRGAEHLPNTLRQVMIYEALGMEMPRFAHIPLILGADRTKLSKRHGAPNIRDYRDKGYPPEALVNYLAFLGWSTKGGNEIMSMEELTEEFDLGRVSDSPSIFDEAKLNWISSNHIRAGGAGRYLEAAMPFFPAKLKERYGRDELARIFDIVSENLPCLSMLEREAAPFVPGAPVYEAGAAEMLGGKGALLGAFISAFGGLDPWGGDGIREAIKSTGKAEGVKGKDLYMPLRVAVTGFAHGPDLVSILEIRGRDDVLGALAGAAARPGA